MKKERVQHHKILVTGLIHKEAYFLTPGLQGVYNDFPVSLEYKNKPLRLEDIYAGMVQAITSDADLKKHFSTACARIQHCSDLNCSDVESLQESWLQALSKAKTEDEKESLIFALLTIMKAKNHWKQIEAKDWTGSKATLKDQILLKIGGFYSHNADHSRHHIPALFKALQQFV